MGAVMVLIALFAIWFVVRMWVAMFCAFFWPITALTELGFFGQKNRSSLNDFFKEPDGLADPTVADKIIVVGVLMAACGQLANSMTCLTETSKGGGIYWRALRCLGFKVYSPNVYNKSACRPPCNGHDCMSKRVEDASDDRPTVGACSASCWAWSFYWHLREAKLAYGPNALMLQIIEDEDADGNFILGRGQEIELRMAHHLQIRVLQVRWGESEIQTKAQAIEQLQQLDPVFFRRNGAQEMQMQRISRSQLGDYMAF